jgi:tetratricopeptide repeat protein 21B
LEWGERALYNMIEICLNPDNEILGGPADVEQMTPEEANEANESYRTADRFFRELRHKSLLDRRYKLVENFIMLASPNRMNVQKALNNFMEMCKTDGTLVRSLIVHDLGIFTQINAIPFLYSQEAEANLSAGAILGSARALLLMKQTQKAKIQLKRVLSHAWSLEEADYLQQCSHLILRNGGNY